MPNAFSPNGDGLNDFFGPKGIRMEYYKSYKFIVYNQWGEEVFKTDKYPVWADEWDELDKDECIANCWDGIDIANGLYSWTVIIEDELGAIRKEVGTVILTR